MNLIRCFTRAVAREWHIYRRQRRLVINTCLFFLMIQVFFPLTLAPDPVQLKHVVPGLVWTGILLASLFSAERLFQHDHDDGIIEQWLISGYPLSLYISAKLLMHWLMIVVPLILMIPMLGVIFSLSVFECTLLTLSVLLGTPAMMLLCGLAAAFTTGLKQKGALMALVLLPLTLPVMIFGSGCVSAGMQALPVSGYLALLGAFSLLLMVIVPIAVSSVTRILMCE